MPAIPFAAARADLSMGTVWSPVPWMMSVGTRNEARSGRKSVVANACAQPSVTLRLACIDTSRDHSSTSSLSGCHSAPTRRTATLAHHWCFWKVGSVWFDERLSWVAA